MDEWYYKPERLHTPLRFERRPLDTNGRAKAYAESISRPSSTASVPTEDSLSSFDDEISSVSSADGSEYSLVTDVSDDSKFLHNGNLSSANELLSLLDYNPIYGPTNSLQSKLRVRPSPRNYRRLLKDCRQRPYFYTADAAERVETYLSRLGIETTAESHVEEDPWSADEWKLMYGDTEQFSADLETYMQEDILEFEWYPPDSIKLGTTFPYWERSIEEPSPYWRKELRKGIRRPIGIKTAHKTEEVESTRSWTGWTRDLSRIKPSPLRHISASVRFRLGNFLSNISSRLEKITPGSQLFGKADGKEEGGFKTRRIYWKCMCGRLLYDDFQELQPGALDDLEDRLNSLNSPHLTQSMGIRGQHAGVTSRVRNSISFLRNWLPVLGNGNAPTNQMPELPVHRERKDTKMASDSSMLSPNAISITHLLMCFNKGEFGALLQQERLEDMLNDTLLFRFLRRAYSQRRSKIATFLSMRSIKKISLIKFAVDMASNVDIYAHDTACMQSHCDCIPPALLVEPAPNHEYKCNPVPARHVPPIGTNYMMHLFQNPTCINPSQTWVYNQLPKRVVGKLAGTPDAASIGWGVYFEEGWQWGRIWTVALALFALGSLSFALVWVCLEKDIQGAFAISSYWLSLVTVLLGYIATRRI